MSVRSQSLPRTRTRLTARAAILAVLVAAIGLLAIVPLRQYLAQQARIDGLQRQTALLQRANDEIESQVDRLHDPGYLERLARECLGMVAPGEVAFVTPGQGPRADC